MEFAHDTGSDPRWGWFGSGAETRAEVDWAFRVVFQLEYHQRTLFLLSWPWDCEAAGYGCSGTH